MSLHAPHTFDLSLRARTCNSVSSRLQRSRVRVHVHVGRRREKSASAFEYVLWTGARQISLRMSSSSAGPPLSILLL